MINITIIAVLTLICIALISLIHYLLNRIESIENQLFNSKDELYSIKAHNELLEDDIQALLDVYFESPLTKDDEEYNYDDVRELLIRIDTIKNQYEEEKS